MSKHVEIKLDPITDGIIDDMAKENAYCTDRLMRIIATDGSDRITDFIEAEYIMKTLKATKNRHCGAYDSENGSIGGFILQDTSEDKEFVVIFNENKVFDMDGECLFVGSMLVMKIEDDYWIGLTDEEMARVKEMLAQLTVLAAGDMDGKTSVQQIVKRRMAEVRSKGFGGAVKGRVPGNLAMVRPQELYATLNRCRLIRMV